MIFSKEVSREEKRLDLLEILRLFQDSAVEHGIKLGMAHHLMLEKNQFWAILRTKFEVVDNKSVNNITNVTYPKVPGRVDFDREYLIKHNDDILVKGISKWVVLSVSERKLLRNPDVSFGEFIEEKLFDGVDKIKVDLSDFNLVDTYQVTENDLDENNHVNNTNYAKVIAKVCDTTKIKEFQIDYLNEAFNNDIIEIYVKKTDVTYILGKTKNENCFIATIKE